jgi:hypothetical protein
MGLRLRMMPSGRFSDWNKMNIAALQRVPAVLIKPQNSAPSIASRACLTALALSLFTATNTCRCGLGKAGVSDKDAAFLDG